MSMKRILLANCALFIAIQAFPETGAADQAPPADLFSPRKAEMRAGPGAPSQQAVDAPVRPTSTPPVPWQLSKPKPTAGGQSAGEGTADGIDLSALRYYAAQNDLARVSAEIKQIRSRHADWQPPDDLFSDAGGGADEQPLWDLYAKGDLAAVHDGIAGIQRDKPEWQPSLDLRSKLAEAEARRDWVAASDAKRWDDVVALASQNASLLTCVNIDLLWRTAEALAATGDEARASDAYAYVLATCRDPQGRLATVQKAALVLKEPGALDGLMRQGRTGADGRSEFEPVRAALLRQKVGAAVQAGTAPMPADVEALKADWAKARDADDADMLAWAAFAGKQPGDAETWFRNAISVADTPKRSEGLALALRDEHRVPEAVKVLMPRAESDPASAKLLIELVSAMLLDPRAPEPAADLSAAFIKAVEGSKSADGAQAYGWHLYHAGQTAAASEWFEKSRSWAPSEPAIVGLLVSAKRMKREAAFHDLVARYATLYPKVSQLAAVMRWRGTGGHARPSATAAVSPGRHANARALMASVAGAHRTRSAPSGGTSGGTSGGNWDKEADSIVAAYQGGDYDRAISMLDQRRQRTSEPSGLSVIRGWTQYHRGDWEGAKQTFSGLHDSAFLDSREGLRVVEDAYKPPRLR